MLCFWLGLHIPHFNIKQVTGFFLCALLQEGFFKVRTKVVGAFALQGLTGDFLLSALPSLLYSSRGVHIIAN